VSLSLTQNVKVLVFYIIYYYDPNSVACWPGRIIVYLTLIKLPVVFHRDLYWELFFFLLYVNDIDNAVPELNVKLRADDTNLFVTNEDPFLLNSTANEAIDKLSKWF